MVMPDMGMAMEMVFDGSNGMPSAGDYADLQPEELGRETIGGEAVTKYRIEAGEGGESYTVLIWATDDGIALDRKSVVEGKRVSVRVDLGGRRTFKKKK